MSRIKVVAPARWIGNESAAAFREIAESLGFSVIFDPQCFLQNGQLAGTDSQRAEALQQAMDDPDADIIWCARGGYGSGKILDQLKSNKRSRKTIIGYSDITYLLLNTGRLGLNAIHAPMVIDAANPEKADSMKRTFQLLAKPSNDYELNGKTLLEGRANGRVIAANLCVLTHMIGTAHEADFTDAILVLEDVGEYLYAIDRMFLHLKQSGILGKLKGLCLGSFTDTQDNDIPWGQGIDEIALSYTRALAIPVASGFTVGHGAVNMPVGQFQPCELDAGASGAILRIQQKVT